MSIYTPLYDVIEGLDSEICELDEIVLRDDSLDEYQEQSLVTALLEEEENHAHVYP